MMKDDTRLDNYQEAIEFLEQLRAGGPWLLLSFNPEKGRPDAVDTVYDANGIRNFIAPRFGRRNLYYSLNPTRTAMDKKPKKTDIAKIEYLHGDLDANKNIQERPADAKARYRETLKSFEPSPTALIDSGNGFNSLWKLAEPIELGEPVWVTVTVKGKDGKERQEQELQYTEEDQLKIDAAEGRSKAMMELLGCEDTSTFNFDRILRLPGTINLPTKKKKADGKVECPASLIKFNGAAYKLDDFPEPPPAPKPSAAKGADGIVDLLPISKRMKNLIRGIDDPEHPYKTRSEGSFAVTVAMASAGCSDDDFVAIFLDSKYPISAHVLDQAKPNEYLAKDIAKARKLTVDPHVERLNESYALVLVSDKAAVMNTSAAEGVRMLTVSAFKQWFANQFVPYQDKKGEEKRIPLADYWLQHKQRRQYEGIVFAPQREVPGHYNLWRGFAVEPRPGDCSKFLAHLRDNVCQGKERLYLWVVGWGAQIVQQPDVKLGTSLVLRGKMGVGKTKVGEVFGSLFGNHYALARRDLL
jgi:hypothetical protein